MDAYTLVSDEVWSEEDLRCSESGLANLVEKKIFWNILSCFPFHQNVKSMTKMDEGHVKDGRKKKYIYISYHYYLQLFNAFQVTVFSK